jgi:hypothetical protein
MINTLRTRATGDGSDLTGLRTAGGDPVNDWNPSPKDDV